MSQRDQEQASYLKNTLLGGQALTGSLITCGFCPWMVGGWEEREIKVKLFFLSQKGLALSSARD